MTTATASRGTFGHKLAAELKARDMGARTLAKLLSRQYGGSVDNRRRAVIRWLRGATPETRNRELVEDALGMARGSLKGDDEDEEVSLLSVDDLLVLRIRQLIRQELVSV